MKPPLLVVTVALYVVLAGGPGPALADVSPRDPGGLEYDAPVSSEASTEPVMPTPGSSLVARPTPEPWGDTDPWADAMQETARIAPSTVRAHLSPYPLVMNDQVRF